MWYVERWCSFPSCLASSDDPPVAFDFSCSSYSGEGKEPSLSSTFLRVEPGHRDYTIRNLEKRLSCSSLNLAPHRGRLTFFALMEHTHLEQIKVRATIHTPFNQLQPIHMTFERTITPRRGQAGQDRIQVLLHAGHKRVESFEMAGFDFSEPRSELFSRAFTYHTQKLLHELVGRLEVWASLPQLAEALPLLWL